MFQRSKLSAKETSQRGSDYPTLHLLLEQHPDKQVHVVRVRVELGEVVRPHGADLQEVREGVRPIEAAEFPVLVVASQTVVSTSLDVQSSKVQAGESLTLLFEEVVGHLLTELTVHRLHGGHDQAPDQTVNQVARPDHAGVVEDFPQRHRLLLLPALRHQTEVCPDETVAEPEYDNLE